MENTEWALILFTVLMETVIGAFAFTTWFRQRNKDAARDGAYRKVVLVLLPIAAVALVASLFHLGRPQYAFRALTHLGSSWLSREIFFSGGVFVLLLVSVLVEKQAMLRKVVDWLAVLAGVCALASMATSYHRTMMPAWQGFNTYVMFYAGAVLLGAGLSAVLLNLFGGQELLGANLQCMVWVAGVALVVQLVALPLYLVQLADGGKAAQASLSLLSGTYAPALVIRWALTLLGVVPLMATGRRLLAGKPGSAAALVYGGLLFLVAGELVGRYLFYVSGIRIMIG